jgi:hypothetical protein
MTGESDNLVVVLADPSLRRLVEIQLQALGQATTWSGAAPPAAGLDCDVAIVDPAAPGALELAAAAPARLVFVSALEPTAASRALAPVAHLTLPYRLAELAEALGRALG